MRNTPCYHRECIGCGRLAFYSSKKQSKRKKNHSTTHAYKIYISKRKIKKDIQNKQNVKTKKKMKNEKKRQATWFCFKKNLVGSDQSISQPNQNKQSIKQPNQPTSQLESKQKATKKQKTKTNKQSTNQTSQLAN